MNRKLHNTILAFSISSGFLMLALMAAVPLPAPPADVAAAAPARPGPLQASGDPWMETRTLGYEADMARAATTAEMVALSSELLAEIAAEAALAVVLRETGTSTPASQPPVDRPRREARRHNALAMPYFSFAHGLRGGGRG